jgi:hypothetical protein
MSLHFFASQVQHYVFATTTSLPSTNRNRYAKPRNSNLSKELCFWRLKEKSVEADEFGDCACVMQSSPVGGARQNSVRVEPTRRRHFDGCRNNAKIAADSNTTTSFLSSAVGRTCHVDAANIRRVAGALSHCSLEYCVRLVAAKPQGRKGLRPGTALCGADGRTPSSGLADV